MDKSELLFESWKDSLNKVFMKYMKIWDKLLNSKNFYMYLLYKNIKIKLIKIILFYQKGFDNWIINKPRWII